MRRVAFAGMLVSASLLVCVSADAKTELPLNAPVKDASGCGIVMGPDGQGIPEATVAATHAGRQVATATTLSDGSFSFAERVDTQADLTVTAKGFVTATGAVERMHAAGNKCGHAVYAVLATGSGTSFVTDKKKLLPKTK